MLTQLTINNFAIVRELEVDLQSGMSAITGETGAGKSIAIDALGLCLGERSDVSMVRQGASRADICARFSLTDTPAAHQWLEENQLDSHDECLLRRTISSDGRSRGFINGTAVPLSQLKELGQLLIQIHGQHAHQQLLKPEYQRRLLDNYANHTPLRDSMRMAYQQWHQSRQQLAEIERQLAERESRQQLLQYQLKELNEFAPQSGEYELIETQHKQLANSEYILNTSQQVLTLLAGEEQENLQQQLHCARQQISELAALYPALQMLVTMLEEATIQISEVSMELRHFTDSLEPDPEKLAELEQRLTSQLSLARKHHVAVTELPKLHQELLAEQQLLTRQEDDLDTLSTEVEQNYQAALTIARKMHLQRQNSAAELSQQLTDSLRRLAMPHGELQITLHFDPEHLTAEGADRIEFLVTTNPGMPLQSLPKVASGGELSRIALAIQVLTAHRTETPALIFDEVDVGISGPTAAIVGELLRQLGESTQVICVTHLPQVAGKSHQHYVVSKQVIDDITETTMLPLNKKERLQELARLLGGSQITRNTLANARDLLAA